MGSHTSRLDFLGRSKVVLQPLLVETIEWAPYSPARGPPPTFLCGYQGGAYKEETRKIILSLERVRKVGAGMNGKVDVCVWVRACTWCMVTSVRSSCLFVLPLESPRGPLPSFLSHAAILRSPSHGLPLCLLRSLLSSYDSAMQALIITLGVAFASDFHVFFFISPLPPA